MVTLACHTIHHLHHLLHRLVNPTLLTGCCGWLCTTPLDYAALLMHSDLFLVLLYFFFFFEIHTIFLHCGITMLGMIWVRACSALVGFRAPTCVRSLHSFPGITVAQVGCCPCVYLTRCIHNFSRYSC